MSADYIMTIQIVLSEAAQYVWVTRGVSPPATPHYRTLWTKLADAPTKEQKKTNQKEVLQLRFTTGGIELWSLYFRTDSG